MKNSIGYSEILVTLQGFTNRSEALYGTKSHACGFLESTLAQLLEELINAKNSQHSEYATSILRRFTDYNKK